MLIFGGRGVNVDFQGFRTLSLRSPAPYEMKPTLLVSLKPRAFLLTPKYMTLNDLERLEWLLYVKFSLLRTAVSAVRLHTNRIAYLQNIFCCMTPTAEMCESGPCSAEYCGSFVDEVALLALHTTSSDLK